MLRFTTAFVRTLAILTITSLAGCDAPDVEDLDDVELDDDDVELRSGLPTAGIPFDYGPPVKLTRSIPLFPTAKFAPKSGFGLHPPTDASYIVTPDTSAPNTIAMDINGVSPYAGNLDVVEADVCTQFLSYHPNTVPVIAPVTGETCEEHEMGCCSHICYVWGGWAAVDNGQNLTTFVDNNTFLNTEMVYGSYVVAQPQRMTWDMNATNGGHSAREKVCACRCEYDPDIAP